MELQKILNILNEANNTRFTARKLNIAKDQSNTKYNVQIEIIYNTEVLISNLCDYNEA